jgi:DNA-binding NtrC family response regulator
MDLYQRLAQSQIKVPALSERREDILVLAEHFLDECKAEFDLQHASFAPSLQRHLVERHYQGNIRELRHLVREIARRAAFELDSILSLDHLPESATGEAFALSPPSPPPSPSPPPASPPAAESARPLPAGIVDDGNGFWNEVEMEELVALRKHRFRIAEAERELGLSSKSRTLTNHLRGLCFKALAHSMNEGTFDVVAAARLVVGREDEALLDRTVERVQSYLEMVEKHVQAHTTDLLYNNLPRDYRKHVEKAIAATRQRLRSVGA